MARILFGTAGWSYADWRGRVYPQGAGRDFDPLAYLARFLDLVEVNSTFYRLPDPERGRNWLERTRAHPGFLFLLKAPGAWTHGGDDPSGSDLERFRRLAGILADAGRLGGLRLQFPWSFRDRPANRERIAALAGKLRDFPVAVEVRHGAFARPDWYAFLRAAGCLPVNIDQPLVGRSLPLAAETAGDRAYFRFHGRNRASWFDEGAGRDQRYDHLYGAEELVELGDQIAAAARRAEIVFVVTNNHFRGQAAVNALQLRFRFAQERQRIPPALIAEFPLLASIAAPAAAADEQGELFA